MAVIATRPGVAGKVFLGRRRNPHAGDESSVAKRIAELCSISGLSVPEEQIASLPPDSRENSLGIRVRPYGLTTWNCLFTARQMFCLLTFADIVRKCHGEMKQLGYTNDTCSPFAHTWERHWTGWQRIRLFCVDGMQAPKMQGISADNTTFFVRRILSGEVWVTGVRSLTFR